MTIVRSVHVGPNLYSVTVRESNQPAQPGHSFTLDRRIQIPDEQNVNIPVDFLRRRLQEVAAAAVEVDGVRMLDAHPLQDSHPLRIQEDGITVRKQLEVTVPQEVPVSRQTE